MKKTRTVRSIRNISWLMTMDSLKESQVGLIQDAAILMDCGKISWVGKDKECPQSSKDCEVFDGSGLVAMPGMIDCHTHLVFAGDRLEDFYERSKGTSYAEILARGGGIGHTVQLTRNASEEELIENSLAVLVRMLKRGVTTVEVKSGYGLNLLDELKTLEVIRKLNALQPISLVPTFLGAHAVPPEYKNRSSEYVDYLIQSVLPKIAQGKLAEFADVFVEKGAFSKEEGERLLKAALRLGLGLKIHADQLSTSGGSELAAKVGCMSASHLEYATDKNIEELAKAGVVAELLPLAEIYLGVKDVVNARRLIDAGVKIAIGTDFNPGSSMCDDLQLAMRLAVTQRKLTVEEAMLGVTYHAACSLGRNENVGRLKKGMHADICLLEARSPWTLAYDWSINPVKYVIKKGELVF